jgi:hypothetical protein
MQLPSTSQDQDVLMSHYQKRSRWNLKAKVLILALFPALSFSFSSSKHRSWRHSLSMSRVYALKGKDIVLPDTSESLEISIPIIFRSDKNEKELEILKQLDTDHIMNQSYDRSHLNVFNKIQDEINSENIHSQETMEIVENEENEDDKENEGNDETVAVRRKAVTKLLLSSDSKVSNPRLNKVDTSVGPRRIKGASNARASVTKTSQLLSAVRRAANAAASTQQSSEKSLDAPKQSPPPTLKTAADPWLGVTPMGFSTDDDNGHSNLNHPLLQTPKPGTVLIPRPPHTSTDNNSLSNILVRVATCADDMDVANLRLSVFSDFTPELRKMYGARSRQVLSNRRRRGATCLVATTSKLSSASQPSMEPSTFGYILGSVECSVHELYGTMLGKRRIANSVLYITEVAVNPGYRRFGIGTKLMEVSQLI